MDASELQEEEREVLASIFEDDPAFKQISDQCFQYKIGEDADVKSFLIEVVWTKEYPDELPRINLDAFYNNHILPSVKTNIVEQLITQCEGILGEAMVFTIVDWAKENHVELMAEQPLQVVVSRNDVEASPAETTQTGKKKEKKEQLSKAQKRKLADRVGVSGERPRGWDWVDLIKHLSQTGKANERDQDT